MAVRAVRLRRPLGLWAAPRRGAGGPSRVGWPLWLIFQLVEREIGQNKRSSFDCIGRPLGARLAVAWFLKPWRRALLDALFEQRQRVEHVGVVDFVAQQPALASVLWLAARRQLAALRPLQPAREWRDALLGSAPRDLAHPLGGLADLRRRELLVDPAASQLDDHRLAHDVYHHHLAGTVRSLHPGPAPRQFGLDLQVLLVLVGETAQQPAADPADLGWVQRQILVLGHFDRDARVVRQESRAAE